MPLSLIHIYVDLVFGDDGAPFRRGRGDAQTQVAHGGDTQDGLAETQCRGNDDGADAVGQDVLEDDAQGAASVALGSFHELHVPQGQHGGCLLYTSHAPSFALFRGAAFPHEVLWQHRTIWQKAAEARRHNCAVLPYTSF